MTLLAFAFGAGMLATVNPCGFAMLPAFLAYYLGEDDDAPGAPSGVANRLAQGLAVGFAVSAGFAAVFTAAGLVVSLGLRSLVRAVPWAAVIIGVVLVVVGGALVAGRQVGVRLGTKVAPAEGRGYRRMAAFGAAYAVASLSCTLAVLLAVVAQATAASNPLQLFGVFAAYGAGAASVLVTLAVGAALAKATFSRGVRRLLPVVNRLGGAVLILSGAYLVAYWLPALLGAAPDRTVAALTEGISGRLMNLLDANRGFVAASAAGLIAVGAAIALVRRRRTRAQEYAVGETAVDCCSNDAAAPAPDHRQHTTS